MNDMTVATEAIRAAEAPIYVRRPARTMIPLMPGGDNQSLLQLAGWLAKSDPVVLLGVVPVLEGQNLSVGAAAARQLRQLIQAHTDRVNLRARVRVRVSYTPWEEILAALASDSSIELLVLNWPDQLELLNLTPAEILSRPPCDIAIVRGPFPQKPEKLLVPMRGGPHAERALDLALLLSRATGARLTSLRLRPADGNAKDEAIFSGMAQVLDELPEVEQRVFVADDQPQAILEASQEFDVTILGTVARPTESTASFGRAMDKMLTQGPAAVIGVKTRRVVMPEEGPRFSSQAISVLVDRWFAENTFHAEEFTNLDRLLALKEERRTTISLALPALNEEKTIGDVIRTAKESLMDNVPLLDEIVLMDSDSTDQTRQIAADLGIPVYIHQELLPQYNSRAGKGEALWKSLYVTSGDILIWVDTDVTNFHPLFVYGLIGPLLQRENLMFIKGFYHRPLRTKSGLEPGRGGRVTELTARPLFNLFYPGLSGIIQPLAGEYGGRREALERLTFTSGYGVETCLLIEVYEKFKLGSIAQVDLLERIHRNQPLDRLSKMAFAIIQTAFNQLEKKYGHPMLEDINRTIKTIHYESGHYHLEVQEIAELERPPMITIPEYRQKRGLP